MSHKSRLAEQKRKQKDSKRNKYKNMKEKGLLGKMEIKKYARTINDLSQYKFIQDSNIYNQLRKIQKPNRENYYRLTKLYNLVMKNKQYNPWIDQKFQ
ncbi:MAG: hypothetical protein U9Q99_03070 [Nanoarchaeota archaeon]|nr:hypothetical protein [Nanoarchaeota archaeon]